MRTKTLAAVAPLLLAASLAPLVRPSAGPSQGFGGPDGASVFGDSLTSTRPVPLAGIATLFRHDPLRRTMSFATGAPGNVVQEREVRNHSSDIDFGCYREGHFTVGIEGGREGVIVDLGSSAELVEAYGFRETVGGGQGFTSIHYDRGALFVRGPEQGPERQQLRGLADFLGEVDGQQDQAPVVVGHTYLVRIVDRHDEAFERIAKFKVIAHTPGQVATIRWERLKG